MRKYGSISVTELQAELKRLRNRYEDLYEVVTLNLTHSSAHMGSGQVRQDMETVNDLRDEISDIEKRLAALSKP